jgi:quinoprotein glucose dehydrogenase
MRIPTIILLASAFASVAAAQTDWPIYGHDPGGRQYSPLKEIDTRNVSKLRVAWTYDTRPAIVPLPAGTQPPAAEGAPARPAPPRNRASQATPLVVDGMMYLSSPYNRIVALEPETGKKIWEYESDATPSTRGIAYWSGDKTLPPQIVVGTMSGSLFTLNAKTGKLTTTFGDNGKVNLKNGIADDFPNGRILMSTPAAVYKNLLFTGGQLQEAPAKGPNGDVRAWDVHTGKLVWTFHTVPRPGEKNHDAWQSDVGKPVGHERVGLHDR